MIRNPLRISDRRLQLWAGALAVSGVAAAVSSSRAPVLDLHVFLLAGRSVGTAALVHPAHLAQTFPYLPAAALPFAVLAHAPPGTSFWINTTVMLACAVVAGVVASRAYGLARRTGVALTLAWFPVMEALYIGQNTALGLLCAMLCIAGMARRSVVLTALPLGVLMYKPTYALPLLAVLLLRGRVREVGLTAVFAALWYAASVVATGGDWGWPLAWAQMIVRYVGSDFAHNAAKAISIPGLLTRAGVPAAAILAVAVIIAGTAAPLLRRVEALEAGSAAALIGLALSAHAWGYDAALALPMLFVAMTRLPEPARTRVVCASYLAAPLVLVSSVLQFDPLALIVVGGTLAWIAVRCRVPGMIGPRRRRRGARAVAVMCEAFPNVDVRPA
jgi:Glycosyltransferase family 87